jgi:hypothetical protein
MQPPPDSNLGKAARLVAEVFGCSVEEAAEVLVLGINARMAEVAAHAADQPQRPREQSPASEQGETSGDLAG